MEYLMTYGWAILIIAVVMVALFSLGILGGNPLSTTCLPAAGVQCSGVVYAHSTGYLTMTVGQSTGNNWASANIFFIPSGTSLTNGVPTMIASATGCSALNCNPALGTNAYNSISGGLQTGQTTPVTLGVSPNAAGTTTTAAAATAGSSASGTLWAAYTISGSTTLYFQQLATVTLKAV